MPDRHGFPLSALTPFPAFGVHLANQVKTIFRPANQIKSIHNILHQVLHESKSPFVIQGQSPPCEAYREESAGNQQIPLFLAAASPSMVNAFTRRLNIFFIFILLSVIQGTQPSPGGIYGHSVYQAPKSSAKSTHFGSTDLPTAICLVAMGSSSFLYFAAVYVYAFMRLLACFLFACQSILLPDQTSESGDASARDRWGGFYPMFVNYV